MQWRPALAGHFVFEIVFSSIYLNSRALGARLVKPIFAHLVSCASRSVLSVHSRRERLVNLLRKGVDNLSTPSCSKQEVHSFGLRVIVAF